MPLPSPAALLGAVPPVVDTGPVGVPVPVYLRTRQEELGDTCTGGRRGRRSRTVFTGEPSGIGELGLDMFFQRCGLLRMKFEQA